MSHRRQSLQFLVLLAAFAGCRELTVPTQERPDAVYPVEVQVSHDRLGPLAGVEVQVSNVEYASEGSQYWQRFTLDANGSAVVALEQSGEYDLILVDDLPPELASWRFLALDASDPVWDLVYQTVPVTGTLVSPAGFSAMQWRTGQYSAVRLDDLPESSRYYPKPYYREWVPLLGGSGEVLQEAPVGEWWQYVAFSEFEGMEDVEFSWSGRVTLETLPPDYAVVPAWLVVTGTPRSTHDDPAFVRMTNELVLLLGRELPRRRYLSWNRPVPMDGSAVRVMFPDDGIKLASSLQSPHLGVLRPASRVWQAFEGAAAGDTLRLALGSVSLRVDLSGPGGASVAGVTFVRQDLSTQLTLSPTEGWVEVFTEPEVHWVRLFDDQGGLILERLIDVTEDTNVALVLGG